MVFLNMKQVKKETEDAESNCKITKLAIGKPGGADFSGEEWELQLKLRCLMCNIDADYTKDVNFFYETKNYFFLLKNNKKTISLLKY
jgi:hypothetical protein